MSAEVVTLDTAEIRQGREGLVAGLDELLARKSRRKLFELFPDTGRFRRELYPKHMEFFAATKRYMEVGVLGGNRTGKSVSGGFAASCFLTGFYPHWWPGRVFKGPTKGIAAGRTNKNTRDIIQKKLFGRVINVGGQKRTDGTGLIPFEWIGPIAWAEGVRDLIDTAQVRHLSGGMSTLRLKSYEQGPGAFEGSEEDFVLLDEEPPMDVYGEAIIRLTSTTGRPQDNGLMMTTFTPLEGYSDVVILYLPESMRPIAPMDDGQSGQNAFDAGADE